MARRDKLTFAMVFGALAMVVFCWAYYRLFAWLLTGIAAGRIF
jgi:hypothetical protein